MLRCEPSPAQGKLRTPRSRAGSRKETDMHINIHIPIYPYTHIPIYRYNYPCTHIPIYPHTRIPIYPYTHIHMHIHMHTPRSAAPSRAARRAALRCAAPRCAAPCCDLFRFASLALLECPMLCMNATSARLTSFTHKLTKPRFHALAAA